MTDDDTKPRKRPRWPPVLLRYGLIVVLALVPLGAAPLWFLAGGSLKLFVAIALPLWFGLATVYPIGRFEIMRFRARAADYRLCPYCGYSLVGLEERSKCPECGREYDMEDVRRWWRQTFNAAD